MSDATATNITEALAALSAAVDAATQQHVGNPHVLGTVLDALTLATKQIEGFAAYAASMQALSGGRSTQLP